MPAVAGSFYPANKDRLISMIASFMESVPRQKAIGIVSPHAGYVYSGAVAGALFSCIEVPDSALIIAPNHRGAGPAFSLFPEGSWLTPLGEVPIDEELNQALLSKCTLLEEDVQAHLYEHSAEVQVPFLQYLKPDIKLSAIVIASDLYPSLEKLGKDIAGALRLLKRPVLLVASSDMTHYESQEEASRKDRLAIDEIIHLEPKRLSEVTAANHITMCGVHAATTMLIAAKELGASVASLVKYQTSGDTTGDYDQVVGYAGIVVR